MHRHKIVVIGKLPPPYMGTSVWYDILHRSALNQSFDIIWFNVNIHTHLSTIGQCNFRSVLLNLRLYFRFLTIIKKERPDLILIPISQSTRGFIKDSVFIRFSKNRAKTLIMLHGSNLRNWLDNSGILIKQYFSSTLKGTTGAIVLGEKLRYLFLPWFPVEKIFAIPNGIDIKEPEQNKRNSSIFIIRYIGSLSPNKGIYELIESIRILSSKKKLFRLILNGTWRDNGLKEKCSELISGSDLPVSYEGELTGESKILAYQNSDLFVFTPVRPEGHPMVIIEAMASGLPIISTDQGAICETVIDGVNGYIVKTGDASEIAERIAYLMNNPDIRHEMGLHSRRLYIENFTEQKMTDRYKMTFYKVLNES